MDAKTIYQAVQIHTQAWHTTYRSMTILLLIKGKGRFLVVVVVVAAALQFGWIALLPKGRNKLHFKRTFYNEESIELNTTHLFVCIGVIISRR